MENYKELWDRVLKELQYTKKVIVLSVVVYFLFVLFEIPYVGMFTGNLIQGEYFLWPLFAVSGCILINNLSKLFSGKKIVDNGIGYIGLNSMTYYVQHWVVLSLMLGSSILMKIDFLNIYAVILCIVIVLFFSTSYNLLNRKIRK